MISDDTDQEMQRYMEAEAFGNLPVSPDIFKNKKLAFNARTRRNDVLVPMDAGGFVKIGEADYDEAADVQSYLRILEGQNIDASASDLEAAGFSQTAIDSVMGMTQQPTKLKEPLTTGQRLVLERSGQRVFESPDPTSRESARATIQSAADPTNTSEIPNILQQIFRALDIDEFEARRIAEGIFGNATATRDIGLGLADFSPTGLFFGAEEGIKTFQRGRQTGDPLTMGLGALEAALSFVEAVPGTVTATRGLKAAIPKLQNAMTDIKQRLSQPETMTGDATPVSGASDGN